MPVFDQRELSTARLRLRPLCDVDATALFAIYSDVHVMRYWSTLARPTARALDRRRAGI